MANVNHRKRQKDGKFAPEGRISAPTQNPQPSLPQTKTNEISKKPIYMQKHNTNPYYREVKENAAQVWGKNGSGHKEMRDTVTENRLNPDFDTYVHGKNGGTYKILTHINGETYAYGLAHNNICRIIPTGEPFYQGEQLVSNVRIQFGKDGAESGYPDDIVFKGSPINGVCATGALAKTERK